MNSIILATTSKYKRALFEKLGLPFEMAPPPCEEIFHAGLTPAEQALRLAEIKVRSLAGEYPNHRIIGADQVLALGNELFTKPGTVEKAAAQLLRLSGRTHCLHTAYAIYDSAADRLLSRVVTARLRIRSGLDPQLVRKVIQLDQSQDCVGGYKFESRGIQWMSAVRTSDPSSIIGLPLISLGADLRRCHRE